MVKRRKLIKIGIMSLGATGLNGLNSKVVKANDTRLIFWQPIDNHYAAFDHFKKKISAFKQKHSNNS